MRSVEKCPRMKSTTKWCVTLRSALRREYYYSVENNYELSFTELKSTTKLCVTLRSALGWEVESTTILSCVTLRSALRWEVEFVHEHHVTWHNTSHYIASNDVTITWPDPATDIKTSKHFTSKHKTSPPWNGRRLVHSKEMIWASRWSVAVRTFYRQILSVLYSSFPFGNFRPRLVRALLVNHYKPSILGYPYFRKHPYKEYEMNTGNKQLNTKPCWLKLLKVSKQWGGDPTSIGCLQAITYIMYI